MQESEFTQDDFVLESAEDPVAQVRELIYDTKVEGSINFFQFNVDDMLYFREVSLLKII